jgi:snRNA-activating protein complex subunit 3
MRLHPFRILVREELTLADVAKRNDITISDLLLVNPELAHVSASAWLPHGTVINLPPTLSLRGRPFGDMFVVSDAISTLERVLGNWTEELHQRKAQVDSSERLRRSWPTPPVAKVLSKPELYDRAVVEEAKRQRPAVLQHARQLQGGVDDEAGHGITTASIIGALDMKPLEKRRDEIQQLFHVASGLEALKAEHHTIMEKPPVVGRQNVVTSTTEHTVRDPTPCTCASHSAELQWAFLEGNTTRDIVERWMVLPCQPLTVLVDALQCKMRLLPYPYTKNSMLFIAGAFYIDDRHEGFDDLSLPIREGMPSNTAYRDCSVYSMSKTTFAELTVKLHEYCVFRHFGQCDHYFYLDDIVPLIGREPKKIGQVLRSDYPRRSFLAPSKHVSCMICEQLPASILTWGDRLAPTSPFLMCPPCFRLFHVNEKGTTDEPGNDYVKFELPEGEHF